MYERGDVRTGTTEILIQRIIRDYYKELYANKMDNLGKMDKYLEMYNHPVLNQEKTENLNRLITSYKMELVIKKLPTNKSPRPESFTGECYQKFRVNTYPSQTILKY